MSSRFYAPVSFASGAVDLTGPEAHHLRDVLRLRVGEQVVLFDGDGTEARAEIATLSKSSVGLRILRSRGEDSATRTRIVLGTAVPKGERFRWLVEKATELGVDVLVPLNLVHSVVDPRETRLEKMRQIVIAACKQSGRNRLMRIEGTTPWDEFVTRHGGAGTLLVADAAGEPLARLDGLDRPGHTVVLAVGPEGGWTGSELDLAVAAGARCVSLGRQVLRVETAAVALAGFVSMNARTERAAASDDD